MRRNLNIAAIAAVILCPIVSVGQTVNIDNGVGGAGHLSVNIDSYGAYGNWNTAYVDSFQASAGGAISPTFAAGIRLFVGGDKVLLTDMPQWKAAVPGSTWEVVITTRVFNVNSTTAMSAFDVVAGEFDDCIVLSVMLRQVVSSPRPGVAYLDQFYTVMNMSPDLMDVEINRVLDADLTWGTSTGDDHVGASGEWVYQREPGANTSQAMALTSGPGGVAHDFYWAGKQSHMPTGGGPAFGYGSDTVVFDNFGLPTTWENYVAYVGYNTPGDSGLVVGQDGHIGIDWRLSIESRTMKTFVVRTMYGAVPEPASMLALGTGLLVLLRRRRRKTPT